MVIDSLAFNLAQVLHRVLALTVGICSKNLFPLQRIASPPSPPPPPMFLESCLCVPIRKQNYYSWFSHWGPGFQ